MKKVIAVLVLVSAGACSHGRHDQDRQGADYGSRPKSYLAPNNGGPVRVGDVPILAALGVVALGTNPDYYKSSYLGGRCVVKTSKSDPLGAPCNNMVVRLIDGKTGKELERKPCSAEGQFAFRVETGREYKLNVATARYELSASDQGPFTQGQELLITLVPSAR